MPCQPSRQRVAARAVASARVTHPQQLLVLLLQLAFQVPHPLLDAPVTLLRLRMDHSIEQHKKRKREEEVRDDLPCLSAKEGNNDDDDNNNSSNNDDKKSSGNNTKPKPLTPNAK